MEECNNIYNHTIVRKAFSPEECRLISSFFSRPVNPVSTAFSLFNSNPVIGEINRFKEKIRQLSKQVNSTNYNFHLTMAGHLQMLENTGNKQAFWRTGLISGKTPADKLTIILNLSRPGDFEGGLLRCFPDSKEITGISDQGNLIIFPAYIPYSFTDVVKGKQFLLLTTALGPPFT
jgi:hypothetical protein